MSSDSSGFSVRSVVTVGVCALALTGTWAWWGWWIEDAAISFAFARNLAEGHGLVAFPGTERVEGYSNPLWVAVLALCHGVGLDLFEAARWSGGAFAVLAAAGTARAARCLDPVHPWVGALAAALLVSFAPFAIWTASGLENALFCALMAWSLVATLDEKWGWAGLGWFGLAITRPEGAAYALVALAWSAWTSGTGPTWRRMTGSFVMLIVVYQVVHLAYFAWPLPMTYYAKVGEVAWPTALDHPGWIYLWESAEVGWWWPFVWGAVAWRSQTTRASLLCVGWTGFGLLFALRSGGDWMSGYRWISLISVPLALWGALSLVRVRGRFRMPIIALAWVLWALPNGVFAVEWTPETSPFSVKRRLDHYLHAARRLGLTRPLRVVDHDMGAMLWWGRGKVQVRDARGLTDVPFALHHRRRKFVDVELFRPPLFDMCHAHASTGAAVRPSPVFTRRFIEIPGYASGETGLHTGNFVRRDLMMDEPWTGPRRPVVFPSGPTLAGWEVVSPEVGAGGRVTLEVGMTARPEDEGFRVWAFLVGPTLMSWDLAPGLDEWLPVSQWRASETFHGRYSLPIPEDAPQGVYRLGFVVLGPSGTPLMPREWPTGVEVGTSLNAHFAVGEVVDATGVELVSTQRLVAATQHDLEDARTQAQAGACGDAEVAWQRAQEHRSGNAQWLQRHRPAVRQWMRRCWAGRVSQISEPRVAARRLVWVRSTWGDGSELDEVSDMWADRMTERAKAAESVEDWRAAFIHWEAAVLSDPSRAWARRRAEQARARLHGWSLGEAGRKRGE